MFVKSICTNFHLLSFIHIFSLQIASLFTADCSCLVEFSTLSAGVTSLPLHSLGVVPPICNSRSSQESDICFSCDSTKAADTLSECYRSHSIL
jgi:hypothetical protein